MINGQVSHAILESISDGILIVDQKHQVHFSNRNMADISEAFTHVDAKRAGLLPLQSILEKIQGPEEFNAWFDRIFRVQEELSIDLSFQDGRGYECKSSPLFLGTEHQVRVLSFRDVTRSRQIEKAIRAIIKGTSMAIGIDFFRALVRHLAEILGYRYALVGELVDGRKVRTLAVWAGDAIGADMTYELEGTPCANVATQGICLYRSDVQQLFPQDRLLVDMNAHSYFGIPLQDKSQKTLGILVLLDDKPLINIPLARDLLHVFASRAAAELSRMRTEQELHHREAFEMLLSSVSAHFMELPPQKTDDGIMFTLEALGKFSDLDRVYLFKFEQQLQTASNTHEWCAPGISSEIDNLQQIPCAEIPWAMDQLRRNQTLYVPCVAELPAEGHPEKAHWEEQGIQSLVCVPVLVGGKLYGFLGFDAVRTERHWDERDLKLLKTFGEVIGNALKHQQSSTVLHQTLKEAEADREKVSAILSSVADALIVTDHKYQVQLMNRAAQELFGTAVPGEQSQPSGLFAVLEELKVAFSRKVTAEPFDLELPAGDTGKSMTLQARVAETKGASGIRSGLVVSFRDVTREREIERMKSEFISTAAHELNTPLSTMMGYTELLLDTTLFRVVDEEQRTDFLREIYSRGEALSLIVDDLLDVSRIELGLPVKLNLQTHRLGEVLAKILEYCRLRDTQHIYHLELATDLALCEVRFDYHRINQALENLLSNAAKYSPPGKRIVVGAACNQDRWRVTVEDQGVGMTPEQLERVFDKFYRADSSDTAIGGLGLGMSIARQIVEAHGGTICLESEEGVGTIATIEIPFQQIEST